jgi:hypothetical protein
VRNAVLPEAEAFSTCITSKPVLPRWRNMTRPAAMPMAALPTTASGTCGQSSRASASASRTAVRPSCT